MSTGWIVIGVLSAGTYALKAAGPLMLGNRTLPPLFERVVTRMPAALLAALVMTSAFARRGELALDGRAVGLLVAGIALWRGAGFVTVVLAAAVCTALARQLGMA